MRLTAALLAIGLLAAGCGGSEDPEQLTLGFVPSREAGQLVDSADAIAQAVSDGIGIPVESYVANDYTALTEAMRSGEADIGAFGPLGVIRAIDRAGAEFILQSARFGSYTYHTQYMVHADDTATYCDGEVRTDEDGFAFCNGTLDADEGPVGADALGAIEDGASLSYVDPTSTSGYLIPALQMQEQGVAIDGLDATFAGGHDASALAVLNNDVQVGVAFDDVRTSVAEQNPEIADQVVVFAYSAEIPNDGFVIRGDLPAEVKQAVTDAMLAYAETEEGQTALDELYQIDGLREAEDSVLDVVRRADEQLGEDFLQG